MPAAPAGALNEGRGVNPGDTPWRPSVGPTVDPTLNEGRGVNPGDTTAHQSTNPLSRAPLNEGRGVNPGDTTHPSSTPIQPQTRSTKAGA